MPWVSAAAIFHVPVKSTVALADALADVLADALEVEALADAAEPEADPLAAEEDPEPPHATSDRHVTMRHAMATTAILE